MPHAPATAAARSLLLCIAACILPSCGQPAGPKGHKAPPPARVEGSRPESENAVVVLEQAAVQRLGITTAKTTKRDARQSRVHACRLVQPPGTRIVIAAPVLGRVMSTPPAPLSATKAGAPALTFLPLLSPDRAVITPAESLTIASRLADIELMKSDARAAMAKARPRLAGAKVALERAETLASSEVGSQRRVDEARTERDLAQADLDTATRRLARLDAVSLKATAGEAPAPMPLSFPLTGHVEDVYVGARQIVAAGAPLLAVVDTRILWAVVSVYAGDLDGLDATASVTLARFGASDGAVVATGAPVQGPPDADATAATVFLYYSVDNSEGSLRRGQRFGARVALRATGAQLRLPWSAIMLDARGDAWVYIDLGDGRYQRHAVRIDRRDGDDAVLTHGPAVGTDVAITGAVELYGTEFGVGK